MSLRHLIALPLLAVAACAHHGEQPGEFSHAGRSLAPMPAEPVTRYADENRDGVVTREEAEADPALAAAFDRFDLDDDDQLDRGEFARLATERRAPAIASVPVRVEEEELPARQVRRGPGHSLNRTGVDELRPDEDLPERN